MTPTEAIIIPGAGLPVSLWGVHPFYWANIRMLAVHFDALRSHPQYRESSILYGQHPISKAEVAGWVTLVSLKRGKVCFLVDDGTGAVQCSLFERHADGLPTHHRVPRLGDSVIVSGKIGMSWRLHAFDTCREIRVASIRMPLADSELCAFWLDAMRLHAREYSRPIQQVVKCVADVARYVPPLSDAARRLHDAGAATTAPAEGRVDGSVHPHAANESESPLAVFLCAEILSFVQRSPPARVADDLDAIGTALTQGSMVRVEAAPHGLTEASGVDETALPCAHVGRASEEIRARNADVIGPTVADAYTRAFDAAMQTLVKEGRVFTRGGADGLVMFALDDATVVIPTLQRILLSATAASGSTALRGLFAALTRVPACEHVPWRRFERCIARLAKRGMVSVQKDTITLLAAGGVADDAVEGGFDDEGEEEW